VASGGSGLDGKEGKGSGKVYCYSNSMYCLKDHRTGDSISILKYIRNNGNYSNICEVIRYLAEITEVDIPNTSYSREELNRIDAEESNNQIWEDINNYFIKCLFDQTKDASNVRQYIKQRGYWDFLRLSDKQFHFEERKMELGYIPSQESMRKHLKEIGYSLEEIKSIRLHHNIGTTNTLTIPFRDHSGRIRGIVARNINYSKTTKTSKYLYSTGLIKNDVLFNFRPVGVNKDLIIVEGIFDALNAWCHGVDNIVALGGLSVNEQQINTAINCGVRSITLCLDNEEVARKKTVEAINKILEKPGIKVFVAELPEGIKDADQIVKEKGIKSFKIVIANALSAETFMGREASKNTKKILEPYSYEDYEKEISSVVPALNTGICSVDEMVRIPNGAITLIAGRPSHGKTTFLLNTMYEMSNLYSDKKFYYFSYEEQKRYIITKILNRIIDKNLSLCRAEYRGSTNLEILKAYFRDKREDLAIIEAGKRKLKSLITKGNINIVDKAYTVAELSKVIAGLNQSEDVGAVFIDYVQRIPLGRKSQDKRVEIADISNYILQNIAKKTGLAVIMGAQLNRQASEEIALEHLKEAGNLEEDANLVLGIYNGRRELGNDGSQNASDKVDLLVKVLKNRDGEINNETILIFDTRTGKIIDKKKRLNTVEPLKKIHRNKRSKNVPKIQY